MPQTKKKLPLWQRVSLAALVITTILMGIFNVILYKGICVNPYTITSRFMQIESEKIPRELDQFSFVYLTDLEMSEEFSKEKGDKLFSEIARLDPDVLLIGGDIFSAATPVSGPMREQMAEWISSVSAPGGKFAVTGEQDVIDSDHSIAVNDVYAKAQVEVIDNKSVLVTNRTASTISTDSGIRLAGLGLTPDPASIAPSIMENQYVLLMSHYPDNLLSVKDSGLNPDQAFAGNSHGSQIKWPILGNYRIVEGSQTINRSHYANTGFNYTISSGVGCVGLQARINSPVEFIYCTLFSK